MSSARAIATREDPNQCPYVIGDDGLARLRQPHADAWFGLQRVHRELTRSLDAALDERYGLSLSSLELLGRLAASEQHKRRLSRLAQDVGLSLSRVSRIIDSLQRRGLVQRRPYPGDTRATDACLTPAGLALVQEAQATHLADVQVGFFDRLSEPELRTLGAVFGRLLGEPIRT
jgi:DNA-binding MarR family transcriptional regulator